MLSTPRFILRHPLSRRQKYQSLRRWVNWQIGSRLVPGPVAVQFVNDSMLLVSPGMTGATGNIYTGLHEFQEMAFVLHFLRASDVFVDVGANVGSYTVLGGAVVGAKCIAVEPVRRTFNNLVLNIHLNKIESLVEARNIGVGSERGVVAFTSGLDTMNHVAAQAEAADGVEQVRIDTLDNIAADSHPALIKVDVEGYETEVISGANRVLSSESLLAIIIELNGSGRRYGYLDSQLHERISGYGFGAYTYSPFDRSLEPLKDIGDTSGNIIYVRELESVVDRLKNAPPFAVHGVSV